MSVSILGKNIKMEISQWKVSILNFNLNLQIVNVVVPPIENTSNINAVDRQYVPPQCDI